MRRLVGPAVILAAVVLGSTGLTAASARSDGEDQPERTLELVGRTVDFAEVDVGKSGFGLGDYFVFTDDVYKDDAPVGQAHGRCDAHRIDGSNVGLQCLVTLDLENGQISIQGAIEEAGAETPEPHTHTLAVTGGTGRYFGADGELEVEEVSRTEAHLTVTLDG